MPPRRARPRYALVAVVTVVLGLASRRASLDLPRAVTLYAGDALWAAMVFWFVALLRPRAGTATLALAALAIAVAVELSQLVHAPWLDALRATRPGALVLGQGFLASDLACYLVGVLLAAALDRRLRPSTALQIA